MEGNKIKTLDDLAALMIRTMASKEDIIRLESRMGGFEGQMGDLEFRMSGLEGKIGGIDGRLGGLETLMGNIEARVGSIESDVKEIKENMVYRDEFDDAKYRIKYVEKKLGIESGV